MVLPSPMMRRLPRYSSVGSPSSQRQCERCTEMVLGSPRSNSWTAERRGVDAIYLRPRTHLNSEIAQQLGCDMDEGPDGSIIRTDGAKKTSVSGVYTAGDITRSIHNVTWASADGVTAGMAVHRSLVFS